MSAISPPSFPGPLDFSTAKPCLHCPCCPGVFRGASAVAGRVCYNCAILHGIELRSSRRIIKEAAPHDRDLVAALHVADAFESMPVMIAAVDRGEGRPAKAEIKTWLVEHEFQDAAMRACIRDWNRFVHVLLGELPRSDMPDVGALITGMGVCVSQITDMVEANILEYRTMALLEDVGRLPTFLCCPLAPYQVAVGVC